MSSLDGMKIPGGCDYCDAYQTVEANQLVVNDVRAPAKGCHTAVIHHDDDCPFYNKIRRQRGF